ncbi:uncharacterized protein [Paramisgurnus dabryanus]|uniref:uncharacterized protein n=1 Tax=Paramisgurnus dabryanus TaxID=90735 RepID=UPI003CCFA12D
MTQNWIMEDSKTPAHSTLVTWSNRSTTSKQSKGSSVSSAVALALAEAEEAKVKVKYAEKEMHIKMQSAHLDAEKARLEAKLFVLDVERKAAAAVAKAEALTAALSCDKESSHKSDIEHRSGSHDSIRRTQEYVQEQARLQANAQLGQSEMFEDAWPPPPPAELFQENLTERPSYEIEGLDTHKDYRCYDTSKVILEAESHPPGAHSNTSAGYALYPDGYYSTQPPYVKSSPATKEEHDPYLCNIRPSDETYHMPTYSHSIMQSSGRVPNAHSYPQVKSYAATPSQHVQFRASTPDVNQSVSDLVRFMARREIVSTSLLAFNDCPENYSAWKASFLTAIRDLNLTAKEEMDLLVKWLGADSREQAKRIRAVHVKNLDRGLQMIWERLDDCFGAPEVIESSLLRRLDDFPKISNKETNKLRDLGDLLMELLVAKSEGVLLGLACLDTARGIAGIVQKLPFSLQERWMALGYAFKQQHKVPFPPFHVLVNFVTEQAKMRNDPSFVLPLHADNPKPGSFKNINKASISVHKTDVFPETTVTGETQNVDIDVAKFCPIHKKPHPLNRCRGFKEKSLEDRKAFLKQKGICFKCVASTTHFARNCGKLIKCSECGSETHHSALHPKSISQTVKTHIQTKDHGGEKEPSEDEVSTKCTGVCGSNLSGKTCSKICLVTVFPSGQQEKSIQVYAIIDDQSNRSLVRSKFFSVFGLDGNRSSYYLKTCTGMIQTSGRRAHGFQVASIDGQVVHTLPTLIECDNIPDNRSEIPSPQIALHHPHLKSIAAQIPEVDSEVPIMMLLGRDLIEVHKVRRYINGPPEAPYALKLDLGWVIVGDVCLGRVHKPESVNTLFTCTLDSGRQSLFKPCPNVFQIKENVCDVKPSSSSTATPLKKPVWKRDDQVDQDIFKRTKDDERLALSVEDMTFLHIMEEGLYKDEKQSWVAPLPFKLQRRRLPNNRSQVLDRFKSLQRSFAKKPIMKEHFFTFMEKILERGHAEVAPPLNHQEECWYLPLFGVYHSKKPNQIRVVFDSSCQYDGVSLNDVLLKGPDLNNGLLGVLLRFRKEAVAITTDIQQMFHCFLVRPEDRNFLRFFWYGNNDPEQNIMEFRMKVHIFGNSPSPAVAIYGLRQAAKETETEFGTDVLKFIERDFYVDDGLKSLPSATAAIDLLKRTQEALARSNLKLHKIASNNEEVMNVFTSEGDCRDSKDMDLDKDTSPVQRTLGVSWNLKTDTFTFQLSNDVKPFTRRGVLSTVNGLYDPFGFAAPVVIQGKVLIRDLTSDSQDWDSPLPLEKRESWQKWRDSLQELQQLQIPRPYTKISPSEASHRELCVFSDASVMAIAAVAYLKILDTEGKSETSFILGKARLAPRQELTIPRLELRSAVLAVEVADIIMSEMDIEFDRVTFFTDSKVVLGYIYNEKRRFYVFVNNRVQRIRCSSHPQQWHYVPSDQNPADHATRSVPADRLKDTTWLTGPLFLSCSNQEYNTSNQFDLVEPTSDVEVRPEATVLTTHTKDSQLGTKGFERFSSWKILLRAVACLIHVVQTFKGNSTKNVENCKGWHCCRMSYSVNELNQAKVTVIHAAQQEAFVEELRCIKDELEDGSHKLTSTMMKAIPS